MYYKNKLNFCFTFIGIFFNKKDILVEKLLFKDQYYHKYIQLVGWVLWHINHCIIGVSIAFISKTNNNKKMNLNFVQF